MKGVLLHGGHGTRLRPLTHSGPKQLIPIAGKPISQYCLEDLKDAGVDEVAIVLGNSWPEKVVNHYGDGSSLGLRINYLRQGEPRGIAHAIALAEKFVGGEPFVVYLGDNILKGGIADYVNAFRISKPDAMILLSKANDPQRFGVAQFDSEGKLLKLIEKPKDLPSPYALVGVYFLTAEIFDAIRPLRPSWRGELEITEAIQTLLDKGCKVEHRLVEGWWKDTGTPEDILEANRLILDDKIVESNIHGTVEHGALIQDPVRIEKGAAVKPGAAIRGPVHIGAGTSLEAGTYVGPYTSVGSNCQLKGCELENTIVMDGCRIDANCRIVDSIIGPDTQVTGAEDNRPRGYRFVVGERSSLRL